MAPHKNFKPPLFDGKKDVEHFITQFIELAEANGWTEVPTLLHLRSLLVDGSRALIMAGVFNSLQGRFGLTV